MKEPLFINNDFLCLNSSIKLTINLSKYGLFVHWDSSDQIKKNNYIFYKTVRLQVILIQEYLRESFSFSRFSIGEDIIDDNTSTLQRTTLSETSDRVCNSNGNNSSICGYI